MATALKEPAQAAWEARIAVGIGLEAPVLDILKVVEEAAGVPVAILDLPEQIPCAYASKDGQPFIFVNGSYDIEDQRFALAHAYGHHVLAHGDTLDFQPSFERPKDPKETQANAFAAEFLAPGPAVSRSLQAWDVRSIDPNLSPDVFSRFAKFFGMSRSCTLQRLAATRHLERSGGRQSKSVSDAPWMDFLWKSRDERASSRSGRRSYPEYEQFFPSISGTPEWALLERSSDSLAGAQAGLPRMPAVMQANALKAYAKGLVPIERLAAGLRQDLNATRNRLSELGMEPQAREPDY